MLKLEDICEAAQLSPSYLIRAFKQHYGMTPHAFLVNRRIQFAQDQLRSGKQIADVALQAGFADQAHFQRAFKQHLAATPGSIAGELAHWVRRTLWRGACPRWAAKPPHAFFQVNRACRILRRLRRPTGNPPQAPRLKVG